jgi:hypothetical protein
LNDGIAGEYGCFLGCCAYITRAVIALMIEAAGTSETSVNFYQTARRSIPEVIFLLAAVRARYLTNGIAVLNPTLGKVLCMQLSVCPIMVEILGGYAPPLQGILPPA